MLLNNPPKKETLLKDSKDHGEEIKSKFKLGYFGEDKGNQTNAVLAQLSNVIGS